MVSVLETSGESSPEILLLQTSDAERYYPMLRATERTVVEYCRRHGLAHERYVGIKRGCYGIHATFNRMFMLNDLHKRGFRGWALYLDADAYIHDLDFDLRDYIADKADRSAVMATIDGQEKPWAINAGVLLFNMAHPQTKPMLEEWQSRYLAVPDETLRQMTSVWDDINDQGMLFGTLDDNPAFRDSVYFEESIRFNHIDGNFIRQFLGAFEGDLAERTLAVEREVAHSLRDTAARLPGDPTIHSIITDAYRDVLGRDPDAAGLAHYSGVLEQLGPGRGGKLIGQWLRDSDEYRARADTAA